MRLAACALLVAILASCDPTLNMSVRRGAKHTIEGCPEAIAHLKECCPSYESYVSCTVVENEYGGVSSPDVSARQSACLRGRDCASLEHAVVNGAEVCGVTFAGRRCR